MSYPDQLTLAVNARVSAEQRLAAVTLELEAERAKSLMLIDALREISNYRGNNPTLVLQRHALAAIDAAEGR